MCKLLAMPIFSLSGKKKVKKPIGLDCCPEEAKKKKITLGGKTRSLGLRRAHGKKSNHFTQRWKHRALQDSSSMETQMTDLLRMIPGQVSKCAGETFCLSMAISQSVLS